MMMPCDARVPAHLETNVTCFHAHVLRLSANSVVTHGTGLHGWLASVANVRTGE